MRAVQVGAFGGPDELRMVELPDPSPGPGQVLVEVAAAGVNRADVLVRSGGYHRGGQPPLVLGLEAAGTVLQVGADVGGVPHDLAVGDRVMAMGATDDPGFYAELAAVPVQRVVRLPAGVDAVAAAALPTAWLSAWYCLRRLAAVQAGESVLVHAAASGVGSAAVQIARDAGATVIAVAGTAAKAAWARELGAHEALDTSSSDPQQLVASVHGLTDGRGADVVLDTVGGETFGTSLRAAGYAGRVVSLANVALVPSVIDTRDFYPKNVQILGFQITSLMEHGYDPRPDLVELLEGVAAERFTVPIDATFPLTRAADAHRRLESRATRGKVVLMVGTQPATPPTDAGEAVQPEATSSAQPPARTRRT